VGLHQPDQHGGQQTPAGGHRGVPQRAVQLRRPLMIPSCMRVPLLARLLAFVADQRGVSAVEFAILLPLMLTLYLGGAEISQAVSADRKTTLVAHTVGDLTAQASNVASSDITNTFSAATAVAYQLA